MSIPDQREARFVIKGLRARPLREWRDHLLGPFLLLLTMGMSQPGDTRWHFVAVAIALIVHFVFKLARGCIVLYPDRLWIRAWNDSFLSRIRAVPLAGIRKVSVNGSAFRIGYVADGEIEHVKITMLAPTAEELYDQVLARLDEIAELRERIEEQGDRRFVVRPPTE